MLRNGDTIHPNALEANDLEKLGVHDDDVAPSDDDDDEFMEEEYNKLKAATKYFTQSTNVTLATSTKEDRSDKWLVLHFVRKNGMELQYASSDLRADKEIVHTAVMQNGMALQYYDYTEKDEDDGVLNNIVAMAVHRCGKALQFASKKLRDNNYIVLRAVRKDGIALQFASTRLRSDSEVVMAAVTKMGIALVFASPKLQENKKIVKAAMKWLKSRNTTRKIIDLDDDDEVTSSNDDDDDDTLPPTLLTAAEHLRANKKFVLNIVRGHGSSLEFASLSLKSDRDVVLAAVLENGMALQFASSAKSSTNSSASPPQNSSNSCRQRVASLFKTPVPPVATTTTTSPRADKEIVLSAVENAGQAVQFASEELKADPEVALTAVRQDTSAFKFCHTASLRADKPVMKVMIEHDPQYLEIAADNLRADKELVIAAVSQDADMLKYAKDQLKQDRDCWIAAGLWSEEQEALRRATAVRVALSTRYSLFEDSTSAATKFTAVLNENAYFQQGNFKVYSPNAFSKGTCDPEWTRLDWPCRGTIESCCMERDELKMGKPQSECCWRYSFRWHLEEAKRTRGFMIQVVDLEGHPESYQQSVSNYALGDGQRIEKVMAQEVGTKVFRVYRPRRLDESNRGQHLLEFTDEHIEALVAEIRLWYLDDCINMETCSVWVTD